MPLIIVPIPTTHSVMLELQAVFLQRMRSLRLLLSLFGSHWLRGLPRSQIRAMPSKNLKTVPTISECINRSLELRAFERRLGGIRAAICACEGCAHNVYPSAHYTSKFSAIVRRPFNGVCTASSRISEYVENKETNFNLHNSKLGYSININVSSQ